MDRCTQGWKDPSDLIPVEIKINSLTHRGYMSWKGRPVSCAHCTVKGREKLRTRKGKPGKTKFLWPSYVTHWLLPTNYSSESKWKTNYESPRSSWDRTWASKKDSIKKKWLFSHWEHMESVWPQMREGCLQIISLRGENSSISMIFTM